MIRLFITLFVVLVGSLFVGQLSVQKIEAFLYSKVNSEFYAGLTLGTFELLDESIAGKTGEDLQAAVISIKNIFDSPINLNQRQQLDLPDKGLEAIDSGAIYMHYIFTNSAVYRNSRQTDGIWSITMDVSEYDEAIALATGPLNLIKDKLIDKDPTQRLSVIADLQKSYDLPLSLRKREELNLTDNEKAQLRSQQVVSRSTDERGDLYWIEVDDSGLIFQAGPFKDPSSSNYLLALLITAFLTVLLIGCLLWMWPLWRDLQRLRIASADIGGGKLDTRVQSRQTSLIRSVLDGFNHMAARTENMVASQRDLTNAVSHELRTPLARMMFDLEMARAPEHAQDQTRHLNSLEFNIQELNTMVDEMLTYAKQERVQSPLELEALQLRNVSMA